jgi:RHS repeat-associated protein
LPLGQRSTTEYDAAGNVIATTDFNGNVVQYQYDSRNRLTATLFPDGTSVTYTYTADGQPATVTDARGVTAYVYDERDRLVKRTDPDGTVIAYTYDAAGNRTSVTTPAGTTAYTFDALNRVATVTDPSLGVTSYSYDTAGNLTETDFANGTKELRRYDVLNRLTYLEDDGPSGVISSYQYILGPTGRRDAVVEDTGRRVDYSYDANDRLMTETLGSQVTLFTYDNSGNTLSKVTSATDQAFYHWDFQNRMVSADVTDSTGTQHIDYGYDADGIRVSQTTGGVETRYLIDTVQPYAQVPLEYRPSGLIVASYVYGNALISQNRGGAVSYYLVDGLGSTRALTNASGVVTDRCVYDAFGRTIGQTGSTVNSYLFTGEQRDESLGLDYLRARYSDPSTGRFLSRDPRDGRSAIPPTLHRYIYAANNPVNMIDPSGTQFSVSPYLDLVANTVGQTIAKVGNWVRWERIGKPAWELGNPVRKGEMITFEGQQAASQGLALTPQAMGWLVGLPSLSACAGAAAAIATEIAPEGVAVLVLGALDLPEHFLHLWLAEIGFGWGSAGQMGIPWAFTRRHPAPVWRERVSQLARALCKTNPFIPAVMKIGEFACDEPPFNSTWEGGPKKFGLGKISVCPVNPAESTAQGRKISSFHTLLGIANREMYIVLPGPFSIGFRLGSPTYMVFPLL